MNKCPYEWRLTYNLQNQKIEQKKTYEHAHAHIPRDNLKRKTKINRLKMVLLFKIGEFKDNYITLF